VQPTPSIRQRLHLARLACRPRISAASGTILLLAGNLAEALLFASTPLEPLLEIFEYLLNRWH
jgi:hypothetical protein